jgi:serine/threonine protein kinase
VLSSHPNTVALHEVYKHENNFYVVLDWIEDDLLSLLEDENFSEEEAKQAIIGILNILK